MRLIEDFGEKETQDTARQAADPENSMGYVEMVKKRADLNAQLDTLLKVYKEKHPAVIAKQSEIARVNEELENIKKNAARHVDTVTSSGRRRADLRPGHRTYSEQRTDRGP